MQPSSMHYFPLALPFLLVFALLVFVMIGLIELGLLKYAYERMGVLHRYVLTVLLLSILGSAVNIPVAQLPPEEMVSGGVVNFFGVPYIVPIVRESPGTIIAVNVGGSLVDRGSLGNMFGDLKARLGFCRLYQFPKDESALAIIDIRLVNRKPSIFNLKM